MEDYGIFIGKIVGVTKKEDSRLQIRILPHMKDTSTIRDSDCPIYPFFFRDKVLQGAVGDYVWVLSDKEFSNGYVLGLANNTAETNEDFKKYSIPEDLFDTINENFKNTYGKNITMSNLIINYWDNDSIHFVERGNAGGFIIAYRNGSIFIMRRDLFFVKVGKAVISLTSKELSINAESLNLQGEYVGLGEHPSRGVLGSAGGDETACGASSDVKVG